MSLKKLVFPLSILAVMSTLQAKAQGVLDNFDGGTTLSTWAGDQCTITYPLANPDPSGINTSLGVLRYEDTGGQYANARFDVSQNFDMVAAPVFKIKIYVSSSSITGSSPNQVALKLQDNTNPTPWSNQTEIVKPVVLDQWQEIDFNFFNDPWVNLDPASPAPVNRTDFNRVVIQVNGENNNDHVTAYIDDVETASSPLVTNSQFNVLVWSDEFDVDGALDASKWYHQTQFPWGNSWFNGEIQHYTDRTDNSYVDNGTMYIVGKQESFTDQGVTKDFTSARLNSKFAFQYGRVEARAKMPEGQGTWPAIWLLGKNISETGAYWQTQGFGTTSWPECGEIDIVEHWGNNQGYASSATHTPSSFGGTVNIGGQQIPSISSSFHTYSLEWTPDYLEFKVDGVQHYVYNPTVQNMSTWPFDQEMYLILNFAFEANTPSTFTQDELEIDYIRVFQDSTILASVPEIDDNDFGLKAYPNPSAGQTTISYTLEKPSFVELSIFDQQGRLVQQLVDAKQNSGMHFTEWETEGLASGLYSLTLRTNESVVAQKVLVE